MIVLPRYIIQKVPPNKIKPPIESIGDNCPGPDSSPNECSLSQIYPINNIHILTKQGRILNTPISQKCASSVSIVIGGRSSTGVRRPAFVTRSSEPAAVGEISYKSLGHSLHLLSRMSAPDRHSRRSRTRSCPPRWWACI